MVQLWKKYQLFCRVNQIFSSTLQSMCRNNSYKTVATDSWAMQHKCLYFFSWPFLSWDITTPLTQPIQHVLYAEHSRSPRAQVEPTSSRPPAQHPSDRCLLERSGEPSRANLNRKGVRGATETMTLKASQTKCGCGLGPRLLDPRWELQHLEKTALVITVHWGKVREPQCTSGYVNSCQECWWVLHRFQNCLPSSTQRGSDNSVHINVRLRAKYNLRLTAEVKLLRE